VIENLKVELGTPDFLHFHKNLSHVFLTIRKPYSLGLYSFSVSISNSMVARAIGLIHRKKTRAIGLNPTDTRHPAVPEEQRQDQVKDYMDNFIS
jgi:hypothetical protein